ncbi:MAG: hypothetical protein HIU84_12910 [Acidobacteria bacterium]|nr:hypothetical protein [Acidobacteriota bacterium]
MPVASPFGVAPLDDFPHHTLNAVARERGRAMPELIDGFTTTVMMRAGV